MAASENSDDDWRIRENQGASSKGLSQGCEMQVHRWTSGLVERDTSSPKSKDR